MKILYLTGMIPARMTNGTEIATLMIIRALQEQGHDVTVAGYLRPSDSDPEASFRTIILDRRPIEFDKAHAVQKAMWAGESVLRNEPVSVTKFRTRRGEELVRAALDEGVDCVLVDKPQTAHLFKRVLAGRKVSVVWHAIEHETYGEVARDQHGLAAAVYSRESTLSRLTEIAVSGWVDHVFALTERDASALKTLGYAGPLDVLPLAVPGAAAAPADDAYEYDIGLLGNWTWSANETGLAWFLRSVVPHLPNTMKVAIGGLGAERVAPEVAGLKRLGFVPDARRFLGRCRVVAVPLLGGTGVSMKVIEAATEGWPTITTPAGVRGLGGLPDSVGVESDAQEFARALIRYSGVPDGQRQAWRESGREWHAMRTQALNDAVSRGLGRLAA